MSLNFNERMLENNTKIPIESPINISNDKMSCSQIPFTYTIDNEKRDFLMLFLYRQYYVQSY